MLLRRHRNCQFDRDDGGDGVVPSGLNTRSNQRRDRTRSPRTGRVNALGEFEDHAASRTVAVGLWDEETDFDRQFARQHSRGQRKPGGDCAHHTARDFTALRRIGGSTMKKMSAWPRILTVAIIGALFISVVADSNVYDKFRKRERTNKGYLSEAEEAKLGAEVHQQVTQQFKLNQNRAVNDYINTLGQRLASTSERPNLQWRFFVVDDDSINA